MIGAISNYNNINYIFSSYLLCIPKILRFTYLNIIIKNTSFGL